MIDNINPNQQPELSEQDADLLSAYIDDVLPIDARRALEARLDNEPFLKRELSALRQTVALVNALPRLKAPRDFTISAEDVAPAPQKIIQMPRRNTTWLFASVAAILVVIIGVTTILPSVSTVPAGDTAQEQVAFANTDLAPTDFESADEADGLTAPDDFSADSAEEAPPAAEIARNTESQAQEASAGLDNRSMTVQPANVMSGQGNAPANTSASGTMEIAQATETVMSYDTDTTSAESAMMNDAVGDGSIEEAEASDMQESMDDAIEADTAVMDSMSISPVQQIITTITNWVEIIRQIFNIIQSS